MGVKTTINLTRAQAEEKYVDLKMNDPQIRRKFRAEAVVLSDVELENAVEELNDAQEYGGGFENYSIVHDDYRVR